tara:strand:+ start:43 stop:249 length:207 start_codon:yes stop_codon:yes gene_type:complete
MSYDPVTGKLPDIDPIKVSRSIINSPIGKFTVHASQLAMSKLYRLNNGGTNINIQNYRNGDRDIFNIW